MMHSLVRLLPIKKLDKQDFSAMTETVLHWFGICPCSLSHFTIPRLLAVICGGTVFLGAMSTYVYNSVKLWLKR